MFDQYYKSKTLFNINYKFLKLAFVFTLPIIIFLLATQKSFANPSIMTRYIGIDPVNNSGYMYDDNFVQYPDNPRIPLTSIEVFAPEKQLWMLGYDIDVVVKKADGSVDVLSDVPGYSEMVHHMVIGYKGPYRVREFQCGISRPIASGSELTSVKFPKGYGYKIQSGALMPIGWHWENPANVSVSNVYLRFRLTIDNNTTAYKDTNIDWIDTVKYGPGCHSDFDTLPGKSQKAGNKFLIKTKRRILYVVPHIHDHANYLQLNTESGLIQKFKPENQKIFVAHDDRGQGPTPWHKDKNHLPVNGLKPWSPGKYGPVLPAGSHLWVESTYNNPHPRIIDNMAIITILWEAVK